MNMKPQVTRVSLLSMQVCVPADWTDAQVLFFAEVNNSCGVTLKWKIRKEGSEYLLGEPERQPCQDRDGFVHIMLDA